MIYDAPPRPIPADKFTMALLGTVALATCLPGRGTVAEIVEFLAQSAVWPAVLPAWRATAARGGDRGVKHWRLHIAVFALSS
ncbi:MAG: hypothetical protein WDN69_22510 [Aliidongia sp.]